MNLIRKNEKEIEMNVLPLTVEMWFNTNLINTISLEFFFFFLHERKMNTLATFFWINHKQWQKVNIDHDQYTYNHQWFCQ